MYFVQDYEYCLVQKLVYQQHLFESIICVRVPFVVFVPIWEASPFKQVKQCLTHVKKGGTYQMIHLFMIVSHL